MDDNNTMEVEVDVSEEDLNAFDEAWDEDSAFDMEGGAQLDEPDVAETAEETAEEPEAQQEPDSADESEEEPEETAEGQDKENEEGSQLFTIKYLGNEEKLTLEQMTELAEKGRNYDHIKEERDALKGETTKYADAENQLAFLKELADRSNMTVQDQIDRTRAMWLMNEEAKKGNEISEADALLRVQKNRNSQTAEDGKGEEPAKPQENETNLQVDRFLKVYPNVPATDIPQEVWELTKELNGDLLSAYQAYELKKLRGNGDKDRQTAQNEKNKSRSTGPRKSAGASAARDSFDEGWDSDL